MLRSSAARVAETSHSKTGGHSVEASAACLYRARPSMNVFKFLVLWMPLQALPRCMPLLPRVVPSSN